MRTTRSHYADPRTEWIAEAAFYHALGLVPPGTRNTFALSDVWINALTGRDTNNGSSPSLAWQSNEAFGNAVEIYGLLSPVVDKPNGRWLTIHYEGAIPLDLLNVQAVVDQNVCLRALGTDLVGVLYEGDFTEAVPYSNSNTLASVTDPTVATWVPYTNQRITWTGGAAVGAKAWVAKNLGSNTTRVSQPGIPQDVVATGETYPHLVAPSTGTYRIESLPTLFIGLFDIQATNNGDQVEPFVNFIDLHMASTGPVGADPNPTGGATNFVFQGCSCTWQEVQNVSLIFCVSSIPDGIFAGRASDVAIIASLVGTSCSAFIGGQIAVDGYTLAEGCGFNASGGGVMVLATCAIEDAVPFSFNDNGDAITTSAGSFGPGFVLTAHSYVSGVGTSIVGSGSAGVGWRVARGRTDILRVLPLVTGTLGDFALDTATTAVPYDVATGAYGTSPLACTWALLGTSFAGSGFGGGAHDPNSGTHLVGPSV